MTYKIVNPLKVQSKFISVLISILSCSSGNEFILYDDQSINVNQDNGKFGFLSSRIDIQVAKHTCPNPMSLFIFLTKNKFHACKLMPPLMLLNEKQSKLILDNTWEYKNEVAIKNPMKMKLHLLLVSFQSCLPFLQSSLYWKLFLDYYPSQLLYQGFAAIQ